ncbi:MAG: sigma-70 family RNA polymerase sigma factor [Rubrivivax sp.]
MQDFAEQVAALRPVLLKMAQRRVRNAAWAEDAVSETLVAALERPDAFAGRAQTRTWLVGILKHKLVDQVRRHTRECALERHDDDGGDGLEPELAPEQDQPAPWGDPQASLARTQLLTQLQDALRTLPPQQGRAFVLRECLEAETDEVCRELGVNANHLGVILHRARHKLRAALAPQWRPALAA